MSQASLSGSYLPVHVVPYQPHRLAYQGESPRGHFRTTWWIEPVPGGLLAHYRMDSWFPGGWPGRVLGSLLATLVRGPMNRGVARRVKAAVEGQ